MFTKISIYRARVDANTAHDEAAHRCHGVLSAQPGFQGRLLARSFQDQSECADVIQWDSLEHGRAAFAAVSVDPGVRSWLEQVDLTSVKMYGMRTNGVISRPERGLSDAAVGAWLLVRWRTLEGVDPVAHARNELLMHHEAFAPVPGYLGAHVLRQIDGPEWMELIAWPSFEVGQNRVETILGAAHPTVRSHMADCAADSSLHWYRPILRA